MKSPVIVSSNSDSGSSSADLEVSLAIDQSHQMRVLDKGGASSSRLVHADHGNDDRRCMAIVSDRSAADDQINVAPGLMAEEDFGREIPEQGLPEENLVAQDEEVGGNNSPAGARFLGPGLSHDLFPRGSDDIASSSTYDSLEKLRGDDDWSGIDIRIPRPHERPWTPPEGFMCLYECYFNHGGIWFPVPRLALEYCEARRVALSQLTCASYRNICAILTIAAELGRSVNLTQLEEMVGFAKFGVCGRFYASMRSGCMILTGISSRIESWKNKYFFVRINRASVGDFAGVIRAGWNSRIGRKLQVLEPVPEGAFSLIKELKRLGQQRWGDFIDHMIKRCRRRVTTGNFTVPLAAIRPYTHKPLKDRKPRPTKKQRSESVDMGLEDLDVVVYNMGSGVPEMVDDREVKRSGKRGDREDDRGRSGSGAKRSKKDDKRKDKAPVVPEAAGTEGRNPVEQVADELLVGDRAAGGASLSFGDDFDFNLEFRGRGRHILEDPVACGEYVRCIQGHPRGPVPTYEELVERDEFLAFSVDLTRMVSNVNFMRTRYEHMLQKNHELIQENMSLKSRMRNMTKSTEEMVGHINTLGQKNEDLKVEVAKWEDEVQSMMGEKECLYHLAKSQMKRLRLSRHDTATSFGEYAIEKVGAGLQEKVGAQLQRIRRHIDDSREMNRISSTVGQIKAFLSFYEEQGSAPEGAVEKLKEDLEKYLKMAAAHNVEKIAEQDFVFPDRADWIPDDELVFSVDSPNRIGQYGLGEEWDSAGEEEARGDGEADLRPSRVVLKVGNSDPTVSLHGREREDGSGSSHVSETVEDEDPLMVDDRAEVSKGISEVAGTSTKAAEHPSTTTDPAGNPDEAAGGLGTDEVDVVNF
ncbi:hypothetical protein AALP_AA8G390900 [Arabis alpina]|uniref:DUF1204 domain-containing protein n=1 Tax=Arabis alpina TaxID=50452 RepID=A0A087GC98_ARAAL|nr:hypothetical protein AALP_AA8G390900 [Arabis alpina]